MMYWWWCSDGVLHDVQDHVLYLRVLPYKHSLHREDHIDEELAVLAVEDYAAVLRSLQAAVFDEVERKIVTVLTRNV